MSGPAIRLAAQVGASLGVSKIVSDVIKNNTVVVTTFDAVRVWTGSIVIGSMVADAAVKHVDARVTDLLAWNENRKA